MRAGQQWGPPARSHLHWEHSVEVPQPVVGVNDATTPAAPGPTPNGRGEAGSYHFRFLSGQEVRRKLRTPSWERWSSWGRKSNSCSKQRPPLQEQAGEMMQPDEDKAPGNQWLLGNWGAEWGGGCSSAPRHSPRLPGWQGGEFLAAGTTLCSIALHRRVSGPQVHLSDDRVTFSGFWNAHTVQIYGFGSGTKEKIQDRKITLICEPGY